MRKKINLGLVLALLFSLMTPFNADKSLAADVIAVGKAIESNTGTATVEGYIVGYTTGTKSYTKDPAKYADTNIAIADSPEETDPAKIMPVELKSGSTLRTLLGLKTTPAHLGKKVSVTGELKTYFTVSGMKDLTAGSIVEEEDSNQVETVKASTTGGVEKGTKVSLRSETVDSEIYYTVDGSEPSASSTKYESPITIDTAMTIKAVALSPGLENSEVAVFEYSILTSSPITDIRKQEVGSAALTTGIVTAVFTGTNTTVYIQDETAGIVVYGAGLELETGDLVKVKGKLVDYQSLLELEVQKSDVTIIKKSEVPQASLVKASELDESKEATLVSLKNVHVESLTNGVYTVKDEQGTSFSIRPNDADLLTVGTSYEQITGVLGSYKNVYQLIPRSKLDVIQDSTKVQEVAAAPGSGMIKAGDSITLASATDGATIYYTTDGSEPSTSSSVYQEAIVIEKETAIKAYAVKKDLKDSTVSTFTYTIQVGDPRIHDIQGIGHASPYENQSVADIEGVVTHIVDANNFYMQDPEGDNDERTAEGILVYKKAHGVQLGDLMKVSGQVKEFVLDGYSDKQNTDLTMTEINVSEMTTVQRGQALPKPVILGVDRIPPTEKIDSDALAVFNPDTDGIDFYESLEGMLVQLDSPKVVAPQEYGEVIVVPGNYRTNTAAGGLKYTESDGNPERISLLINDRNYVAKTGDYFAGNVTGVVSYGFSNYKVLTDKAKLPELKDGGTKREVTSIEADQKKLTIASYNLENFSAESADDKLTKLAEAIVTNLKSPDIIGLTEMQDNDGAKDTGITDAAQSYEKLIGKINELGGPVYQYTDIAPENNQDGGAPGGNIRVGFLYKQDKITLTPGVKGTATEAVGFSEGTLTLNPGRIDPTNPAFASSRKPLAAQFEFNGEKVIVVANHFNSKGGDQPLFGKNQPPVLSSEIQRLQIASIVNGFVKDVKAKDEQANVVLLGDFNDFEFSKPLEMLKGKEMTNMVDTVPFAERYSYTYQGNSQVLDHILVSNNMAAKTKAEIVHINSSFTEADGRASDHDPLIIQTELTAQKKYNKIYNLVGYKAKKLVVDIENSLVMMDRTSSIKEGIWVKATATLNGEGLEKTKIIISPKKPNSIVDFEGSKVKEVLIENNQVKEIRGAEHVKKWKKGKHVDASLITFYHSNGEKIASPFKEKKKKKKPAKKRQGDRFVPSTYVS